MAAAMKIKKNLKLTNKVVSGPQKVYQMARDASQDAPLLFTGPSGPIPRENSKHDKPNSKFVYDILTGPSLSGQEKDFPQKLQKCKMFDTSTTIGV